jgi:hypothetical protein
VKFVTQATVHYCDGCSKAYTQLTDDDLPNGFYMQVTEVSLYGADAGAIYACQAKCILPAIKRRREIWNPNEYTIKELQ